MSKLYIDRPVFGFPDIATLRLLIQAAQTGEVTKAGVTEGIIALATTIMIDEYKLQMNMNEEFANFPSHQQVIWSEIIAEIFADISNEFSPSLEFELYTLFKADNYYKNLTEGIVLDFSEAYVTGIK